jgi:hypothetical protein
MAKVADHYAECRSRALTSDWPSLVLFPSYLACTPTITQAEWRVVPTGEALQRWTGLPVYEAQLVWLSDGAH